MPMTKTKQTADQYNTLRSEMKSKISAVQEEKRKTEQQVKEAMSFKWLEEAKKLWKEARTFLTKKFSEENADLIAEYQELYTQKKLDDATFQKGLEEFRKLNPEIDEKSLKDLIMGKTEKKEDKETLTKSLEFEGDTFKIDSKGRKEEKRNVYGKGEMKVKVNATGDVIEYLEGDAKGEQIFITYDAFIREVMKAKNCSKEEVEKKYLMTIDELKEKMKDKPDGSEEYKKFFNKEVKGHLAGYWYPYNETFSHFGVRSDLWLVGGDNADFDQLTWGHNSLSRTYGFSGRLLKN